MLLNGGKEPFPMELTIAQPVADLQNIVQSNINSRSIMSAITSAVDLISKAIFFALIGAILAGSVALVAFSPLGIIWLLFVLIMGMLSVFIADELVIG
jgi:hypothetical protein